MNRCSSTHSSSTPRGHASAISPRPSSPRPRSQRAPLTHAHSWRPSIAVEREQYLDFLRLRRFRQSLLVRRAAPADPRTTPRSAFTRCTHRRRSSWREPPRPARSTRSPARSIPAAGGGGPVRKLLDELVAPHPADAPGWLRSTSRFATSRRWCGPLEDVLADACERGFVELHAQPAARSPARPPERGHREPARSPAGRASGDRVTTLLHVPVRIRRRERAEKLLPLLDGTRDRAALAAAVPGLAVGNRTSRARRTSSTTRSRSSQAWVSCSRRRRAPAEAARKTPGPSPVPGFGGPSLHGRARGRRVTPLVQRVSSRRRASAARRGGGATARATARRS
jgi:hypothetical protein